MTLKNNMNKNNIENFINRLKRGEDQIINGEVTDADIVFKEMKEKYGL